MGQNVTIAATPPAAMIVQGDDVNPQAGLIYNQSTTNTLYIGNDTSVSPGDPLNNTPVPPGQYVPFDGSENIYAVAAAGQTVPVAIMLGISGAPFNQNITITGPTTVIISGTVQVNVANTPAVIVANTPNVNVANTPNVNVGTVSGSINIAAVAGNVDVLGVGGFISPGQYTLVLNDTTGHVLNQPSTFTYTTSVFNMSTFQSYSLSVSAWNGGQAAGGVLVAEAILNYYADAGATILIDTEAAWFWVGNGLATLQPLRGSGPLKGAFMTVTINMPSNGGGPVNITSIVLYGAGRSLPTSIFQQTPPPMTSGITVFPSNNNAIDTGADGLLLNEINNTSMAVSNTYWKPLPLFKGSISFRFSTAIALGNDFVICSAQSLVEGGLVPGANAPGCLWNPASAAGVDYNINLSIGNCPLYFIVKTTAVAGPIISVHAEGI